MLLKLPIMKYVPIYFYHCSLAKKVCWSIFFKYFNMWLKYFKSTSKLLQKSFMIELIKKNRFYPIGQFAEIVFNLQ